MGKEWARSDPDPIAPLGARMGKHASTPETTIVLVRCGRTEWDDAGRLQGKTDLPLSESGRTALDSILDRAFGDSGWPELGTVYAAPDEACIQTADRVAHRAGARVRPLDELGGIDLGVWEGLLEEELMERFPTCYHHWREDPTAVHPPEGETPGEVLARLASTLAWAMSKSRGRPLGVVLRPMEYGMARCLLRGRPLSDVWSMAEDGPTVEALGVSAEACKELAEGLRAGA